MWKEVIFRNSLRNTGKIDIKRNLFDLSVV